MAKDTQQKLQILELLYSGAELDDILLSIIEYVESANRDMLCSILRLDASGRHLINGIAPSLSPAYTEAINGVAIGDSVGSCGTAAFLNRQVIVEDINTHPYWAAYKALALDAGLQACWSQPILSRSGEVLGTFAIYYSEPRAPSAEDLETLQDTAALAALTLELSYTQEELKKRSLAIDSNPNMILITDENGLIEYANKQAVEATGFTQDELKGQSLKSLRSTQTPVEIFDEIEQTVEAGDIWQGELLNTRPDGEQYWCRLMIAPIKDEQQIITHYIATVEDTNDVKVMSDALNFQARHDKITGLINRYQFELELRDTVQKAQYNHTEHALCYMDLDHFNVINDTYGHVAGDELLRQIASTIQGCIKKSDTLARIGGDEFTLIMNFCNPQQAHEVAERILHEVQSFRFHWEGRVFSINISIGLVSIDQNSPDSIELLKRADAACQNAKESGRHCIKHFDAHDSRLTERESHARLASKVQYALDNNRFVLFAQPIQSTRDGGTLNYEILVRMLDKDQNIVPPGIFLPIAEAYSLITDIDRWVISTSYKWIHQHLQALQHIDHLSINLSGASVGNDEMLEYICDTLAEHPEICNKITFEITETAAISNFEKARSFIQTITALGCRFSLDDFGSGLSSFTYLKNMPVSFLKIDGAFIRDIVDNPIDAAMVSSINEVGHVIGLETVAEFVEDDAIIHKVTELGIDFLQGYGIGKPMPLDAILKPAD